MVGDKLIQVSIVYSRAAREVHEVSLLLASSCTVIQAVQMSGVLQRFPELEQPDTVFGIWGRKSGLRQALRDRDRVEVYRPLRVDPKVARRERFARQGARSPGLFVNKRLRAATGD